MGGWGPLGNPPRWVAGGFPPPLPNARREDFRGDRGRDFATRRFGHAEATSAIVTSYYWHFVDVVWIGLFATIYLLQ